MRKFILAVSLILCAGLAAAQTTKYSEQEILNRIYDGSIPAIQVKITGISPVGSTLTATYVWVGDASGYAQEVPVSGDATLASDGTLSIGALKITNTMLAGSIALSKLASSGFLGISSVTLTWSIIAGSGTFSQNVDVGNQLTAGAASTKSTFTSAGNLQTGAITASSTLGVTGQSTFGAAATKSTFTTTGHVIGKLVMRTDPGPRTNITPGYVGEIIYNTTDFEVCAGSGTASPTQWHLINSGTTACSH